MIIRLIEKEDIPACGVIYAEAFAARPYYGSWSPSTAAEMLEGLLYRDPASCWCVEENGSVRGFAFCTSYGSYRATIQEFAIAPEVQGRGLGTALMAYVLAQFSARNLRAVDLVVNRDAQAFRFYKKFGFVLPDRYTLMAKWL